MDDLPIPVFAVGEAQLRVATAAEQDEFFADFLDKHFGDNSPGAFAGLKDGSINLTGHFDDAALFEHFGVSFGEDGLSVAMEPAAAVDVAAFRLVEQIMKAGVRYQFIVQPVAPGSYIVTVNGIRTQGLRDRKLRLALRRWRRMRRWYGRKGVARDEHRMQRVRRSIGDIRG